MVNVRKIQDFPLTVTKTQKRKFELLSTSWINPYYFIFSKTSFEDF